MTTLLTGISVGLGALVVLLLALLVIRWRSDRKQGRSKYGAKKGS